MMVDTAYLLFLSAAALAFFVLPVRAAILLVTLGGWFLLPVGHYPPMPPGHPFPYWVSGIALPTDMLLTKAWVPPVAALVLAAMRDRAALTRWRPGWIDALPLAWCIWPLAAGVTQGSPPPFIAMLYLLGSWGASWLLGRIWFADREGRMSLLGGVAFGTLACLPVALVEGWRRPFLYDLLYGPHPYREDGAIRRIGFRPIGLLEHGNQWGIWVAMTALAALWLAVERRRARTAPAWTALAAIACLITAASQSSGGLLLFAAAVAVLLLWSQRWLAPALAGVAAVTLLVSALHLSGVVPLRRIVATAPGQVLLGTVQRYGGRSFTWRIDQDVSALGLVKQHAVRGLGRWDWWRPLGSRPWGLSMLIVGQFGLIGLLLAFGTLLVPAGRALAGADRRSAWSAHAAALPLALIVVAAAADALLNAFLYFPALLAAGAIAGGDGKLWMKRAIGQRRASAGGPASP